MPEKPEYDNPHPTCWVEDGQRYEHTCQEPSGYVCAEKGCDEPAGTKWGRFWCPEHDVKRIAQIDQQLKDIVKRTREGMQDVENTRTDPWAGRK